MVLLAALLPVGATAATSPPRDAAETLSAFRRAAAAHDAPALAALARTPFLFEGRGLGRDAVAREVVPALMTPPVRRCLATAPVVMDDGQPSLWCRPYGFLFERTPQGWRWSGFVADTP